MKNLTVPQLKLITHKLSRQVLGFVRSKGVEVCGNTPALKNKEIAVCMDVISECYVDALSDMAFLVSGDEKKVKALLHKNHKEIYARILGIYNIKAAAREQEIIAKKTAIIKPPGTGRGVLRPV